MPVFKKALGKIYGIDFFQGRERGYGEGIT